MKPGWIIFNLSAFVLIFALVGCTTPATQPAVTPALEVNATPTPHPASAAVLDMVARLNDGDVEGSLAYFADDATAYLMGLPPTGIEIYTGKEQIRQLWEDSVANHFKWEVKVSTVSDNEVHIKAKTWHDFTSQLGVAPLEYIDTYEIKDGKIIAYASWITAESLARFKPAFAEAVPPEPAATLPSVSPLSELTVTISGGTCTTGNPLVLKAGQVKAVFNVQDTDKVLYALTLFNLDEGKDFLDLMAATAGSPPAWADMLLYKELGPGQSDTYSFALEKGPLYLVCWSQPPETPIGNAGPFFVVP